MSHWCIYRTAMTRVAGMLIAISIGSGNGSVPSDPLLPHDDIIKWKHFPYNWPFVRGIHRSPVNSPHKGQCRRALMFSLI